jgi:tight adherence protein B
VLAGLVLAALLLFGLGRRRAAVERTLTSAGVLPSFGHDRAGMPAAWRDRWPWLAGMAAGLAGGGLGLRLIGPIGLLFAGAGPAIPMTISRRRRRKDHEALELQLGELAATIALGVKSGLSIPQSLELAAEDAEPPMASLLERALAERRLGSDLAGSLDRLGASIATDDARLLVLILVTHARSGGNLASALQEVAVTIRHRLEARRELRALTAQGRISGAILGTLPIGFFVLMAATSGNDLASTYRSGAGAVMVMIGLVLEGLAYLWIRRLLRIEV